MEITEFERELATIAQDLNLIGGLEEAVNDDLGTATRVVDLACGPDGIINKTMSIAYNLAKMFKDEQTARLETEEELKNKVNALREAREEIIILKSTIQTLKGKLPN